MAKEEKYKNTKTDKIEEKETNTKTERKKHEERGLKTEYDALVKIKKNEMGLN